MNQYWILTCEHASRAVPIRFQSLFANKEDLLATHRGYDIGAERYARSIANKMSWPLFCGQWTRLLVDLNRSEGSPNLLSSITKTLTLDSREEIVCSYYNPFRTKVRQLVQRKAAAGACVVHLSCHSFTPVLHGAERKMDLGILYDPSRDKEKSLAQRIRQKLLEGVSMRVRFNAPYRGTSDGHVTALRKIFPEDRYIGLELEVNQLLYASAKKDLWQHVWLPRLIEALRYVAF
jgi:predicted N-formylglutamate amidohydrolase